MFRLNSYYSDKLSVLHMSVDKYFDIQNSQALWLELANLIMGAEGDLILAVAFKALEPAQEPSFDDNAATRIMRRVRRRA